MSDTPVMTPAQDVQLLFQHVTRKQVQDETMAAQDSALEESAQSNEGKEERPSKWPKEIPKAVRQREYCRGRQAGTDGEARKTTQSTPEQAELEKVGRPGPVQSELESRNGPATRVHAAAGQGRNQTRGRASSGKVRKGVRADLRGARRGSAANPVQDRTAVEGVEREGRSLLQSSLDSFLGAASGVERPFGEHEGRAQDGAIKMGIAQKEEGKELAWIYQRWGQEQKKLEKVPNQDPVAHSVVMGWMTEILQGMAATRSVLRFHSTRPLAESYQGETVTFLLTLGFRDPFMNRMRTLLGLMCGLGATKVAAFRMRPAKAERQPLVRVLEERFQSTSRNWICEAHPAPSSETRATFAT